MAHSFIPLRIHLYNTVELWEGRSSGHRFPMKLSLVGPASSHSPSIPWASVSVYKEGLWDCKACEKTNRPTLRLSRDPALQKRLQADIFTEPPSPGLLCSCSFLTSCSAEAASIDVAAGMLKSVIWTTIAGQKTFSIINKVAVCDV